MFERLAPRGFAGVFVFFLFALGSLERASAAAPTISGSPRTSVYSNTWYVFTPAVVDADGDALTFTIINKPSWAGFVPSRGELWGRPGPGDVGTYWGIRIRVSDGTTTTELPSFPITVRAGGSPNKAPTISGTAPTSVASGAWYKFVPNATDADGDKLMFSITNKPSWASFITSRGELWGRPGPGDAGTTSNIRISVSDGVATATLPSFPITVTGGGGGSSNSPPKISGTPRTSVEPNKWYKFLPTATDVDGDALTFSIANKPSWAGFVPSRGELWGRPGPGDVGNYGNIRISVSDGKSSASLPAFGIAVNASESGSATLSWQPPTQNEDGSPLNNLAGYIVYWGTASRQYSNSVTLDNPGLTSYVVSNLGSGKHYFAMRSVNSQGAQSNYSAEASKTIP